MPKLPHNKTVYAEYVFSNVMLALNEQGREYTVVDLASAVGLKPTNNFKRRVNQMVAEGLIIAFPAFSPRGGMMKVYTSKQEELKEMPF